MKSFKAMKYRSRRQKKRERDALVEMSSGGDFDIRADLTFKKGIKLHSDKGLPFWTRLTRDKAENNIAQFLHRLNREVFKKAYVRYKKQLKVHSVIEGSDEKNNNKELHSHMLIECPEFMDTEHFIALIVKHWNRTDFGHRIYKVAKIDSHYGSIIYNLKDGAESLDLMNTNI